MLKRVLVLGVIAAGLAPIAERPALAASPPPVCADVAAHDAAAKAMAVACKRDVAVESSRSEYAQVVVKSDGRMTFESTVVPQRARRANGRWADIDLGLRRGKDGLLRPGVSLADVTFSNGGIGPMATVRQGGKAFTMSWPSTLPAPKVVGDSATYANVLSDVDLVVRATRTGFTHVLVVKTPAAAANPAVKQIRFGLGGDATMRRLPDGSLRAMAGQAVIAHAPPATMWDSGAVTGHASRSAAPFTLSSAAEVGDRATVKPVATELAGRELVLRPHAEMLSAPASAYPLFVDPDWSVGEAAGQKWAYATNNNITYNTSVPARVGRDISGVVFRSFFEFPTSNGSVSLHGKHIQSAYVAMNLTHSWNCDWAWTHMWWSAAISAQPRSNWGDMGLLRWVANQQGHANELGENCPAQPDMPMNFKGDGVTQLMRDVADAGHAAITFGFAGLDNYGGGEDSTVMSWMKYHADDAKLIVDYDSKPTAPIDLQVGGVACPPSGVLTVGTLTPTLSATHPDGDGTQTLSAQYEWIEVPAGGMGAVNDDVPGRKAAPPTVAVTANGRATTAPLSGMTGNVNYAFRAKSTDPDPYYQKSPWSGWCLFTVDTGAPNVALRVMTYPAGPAQPGVFRISSTSTDVKSFKYGWGGATTEILPNGTDPTMISALVTLTAPKFGKNILYVSAVDHTLNEGFGSKQFTIGRPSPAVAQWPLESYPGMTQAQALTDQQPSLNGDTPLTATNLMWTDDTRLMGGKTAAFTGSTSASTSSAVINPVNSFSVSTWVRLDGALPTTNRAAVVQDGDRVGSFVLGYQGAGKWGFWTHERDADNSSALAVAVGGPTPVAGQWTHLAGVYDAPGKRIQLYVNGTIASTVNLSGSPQWTTQRAMTVGREKWNGVPGQFWTGGIADVQVFDRVLVPQDFTGALASDPTSGGFNEPGFLTPIQAGKWDFNAAVPCYDVTVPDTCEAPDNAGWNRWLAMSRGADVVSGHSGSVGALSLDASYFGEPSMSEAAQSARKSTSWQYTPVLRTDQSFTVAGWFNTREVAPSGNRTFVSQDGTRTSGFYLGIRSHDAGGRTWGFMMSDTDTDSPPGVAIKAQNALTTADVGRWVHLIAVYDAQAKEMRLYVNGVLEARNSRPATPWNAGGPLTLGRAKWNGGVSDSIDGAVDDLNVFQGAMTSAQAATFFASAQN